MALSPTIRVNARISFPALVNTQGPVTIAKNNGIYSFGFTITAFGTVNPPVSSYNTTFVLGWDSVNQIFVKIPLSNLGIGNTRVQRSVTATPIVIVNTDQVINCNINVAAACTLPTAASRNGTPLTFVDIGAQATAHNITLTASGGDLINGNATFVMTANRQVVTLVPANDGVNAGWSVE